MIPLGRERYYEAVAERQPKAPSLSLIGVVSSCVCTLAGMAPKPKPLEDVKGGWRWFANANAVTRAANPRYYWFRRYHRAPRFFWDEIEVTEEEFRTHAPKEHI